MSTNALRESHFCAILKGMPTHFRLRSCYAGLSAPRRFTWLVVVALACVVSPVTTYAQGVGGGGLPVNATYQTIASYTLLIAEFFNIMTWFVFSFLIFLLDPRFIFDMKDGAEGSLMDVLNLIWWLCRDLMNVAFAVGLIGAAIYTVVTANKEFVSAHLKTFVMAVVLVNFSWFIPRVALDIANIATATIYSIPTAIVNPAAECTYVSTKKEGCFPAAGGGAIPAGSFLCKCKALAEFRPFPGKEAAKLKAANATWQCYWAYCIRFVELDTTTSTAQGGILNGLIVNHARLPQLAVVTRTDVDDDIADLLMFVLRQLIVIVMHIAIFFPLLALLLALVIRIPILWLTMAFMPLYFLSWVIPDEVPGFGAVKEKAKMIWDWFLKAAFLPAAVAVPLSIGYVMANAGSRLEIAGLKDIPFNLIDGMGNFAQLLWVIMVLGILWSGTFMVLEMMTADMPGGEFIGQIKQTGEQAGKFAAELPLSTVPIPGVAGTSLLSISKMLGPNGIQNMRNTIARVGPAGLLGGGAGGATALEGDKIKTKVDGLKGDDRKKFAEDFEKALTKFNTKGGAHIEIEEIRETFKDTFKDTGVQLDDKNFKLHIESIMKQLNTDARLAGSFKTEADLYTGRKNPAPAPSGGI